MTRRPEERVPPEVFYSVDEANKYLQSTRMKHIQTRLARRAVELLGLPEGDPLLLLDIGCGTGLSGQVLEHRGHHWVGTDISRPMLELAVDRNVEGDVVWADMGEGLPFRAGVFDGAISVSALQWLCNVDKKSHHPVRRLKLFFQTLFRCLRRGARAVFQFYPKNIQQIDMITKTATWCGFGGGLVTDFPNSTKAKKHFLVCLAGQPEDGHFVMPSGLDGVQPQSESSDEGSDDMSEHDDMSELDDEDEEEDELSPDDEEPDRPATNGTVLFTVGRAPERRVVRGRDRRAHRPAVKTREWVQWKKQQRSLKGEGAQRRDSKYTGRRRKGGW